MMNYSEFLEEFKSIFMEYAGNDVTDMELQTLEKINESRDAFVIRYADLPFEPALYMKELYDAYENGQSVYEIAFKAHMTLDGSIREIKEMGESVSIINPENLYAAVVNTEMNRHLLRDVPHREFEDLSVIARYKVTNDASYLIHNSHATSFSMTPEEMLERACSNTLAEGFRVANMSEILGQLAGEDLIDENFPMYVITNERQIDGAAAIIDKTWMKELSERLDDNLYILPSSRHEVIAVPEGEIINPDFLKSMVTEINHMVVIDRDMLSDNVYHFDMEKERLHMVGNEREYAEEKTAAPERSIVK